MALFGQQLQVKRIPAFFCHRINQAGDGRKVHHGRLRLAGAKTAIKIPKINAFRQRHATLTFDVFANFVFGGFQQSVCVFAFGLEWECFFQVYFLESIQTARPPDGGEASAQPWIMRPAQKRGGMVKA